MKRGSDRDRSLPRPGRHATCVAVTCVQAPDLALRLHILYFLAEVLANPEDRRFKGKAIGVRNLVIVGAMSLAFPALHLFGGRWQDRSDYPWALDDLYGALELQEWLTDVFFGTHNVRSQGALRRVADALS